MPLVMERSREEDREGAGKGDGVEREGKRTVPREFRKRHRRVSLKRSEMSSCMEKVVSELGLARRVSKIGTCRAEEPLSTH